MSEPRKFKFKRRPFEVTGRALGRGVFFLSRRTGPNPLARARHWHDRRQYFLPVAIYGPEEATDDDDEEDDDDAMEVATGGGGIHCLVCFF